MTDLRQSWPNTDASGGEDVIRRAGQTGPRCLGAEESVVPHLCSKPESRRALPRDPDRQAWIPNTPRQARVEHPADPRSDVTTPRTTKRSQHDTQAKFRVPSFRITGAACQLITARKVPPPGDRHEGDEPFPPGVGFKAGQHHPIHFRRRAHSAPERRPSLAGDGVWQQNEENGHCKTPRPGRVRRSHSSIPDTRRLFGEMSG